MLHELGQIVALVRIAKVGRLAEHHGPGCHPLPELVFGVAFEAPLLRIAAIMHKEGGEHVGVGHHAQKLCVVAKLHEIVRRRRCCRRKAERDRRAFLDKPRPIMTIGRFEDGAIVD